MDTVFHSVHGGPGKAEPDCITELAAYMLTIITATQDYEHPAWERYDRAHRDKAAATRNKTWSQIDPALFTQMFTGRAKHLPGLYLEHETACPHTTVRKQQALEPSYMPSAGLIPKQWWPLIQQRQLHIQALQIPPRMLPKRLRGAPPSYLVPTNPEADCIPTKVVPFVKYH